MTATRSRVGDGVAGAALLVAAVTVLSRAAGFGRTLGFSYGVGKTCLGSAYTTANTVPNVLFEVVAGGALAGVVVPLLARAFRDGDRAHVDDVCSALVTWTLAVLVPLAAVAALAGPVVAKALAGSGGGSAGCTAGVLSDAVARMVLVFAPQIPLYGLAVVSAGILQSQQRFFAAAFAPLVSSVVVVSAYVWFGALFDARSWPRADLPGKTEAVLTVGTTAGVLALALTTLVPMLASGVRLRPTFRFPPGVAVRARSLALAGLAALLAQQLLTVVVVVVANARLRDGGLVVYTFAWTLYLLPYAVLAVPLATSAFPALARHAEHDERDAYAAVAARTTRAVVLAAALGAGLLAGTARPLSQLLDAPGDAPAVLVSRALVTFAPGLLGYALVAHLGRALYALHAGRAAATATVAGWLTAAVLDVVLGTTLPSGWVVAGFGAANSVGMTVAGVLLLRALRARAGSASTSSLGPTLTTGLAAALTCACAAGALSALLAPQGRLTGLLAGLVAAGGGAAAYGACAALLDRAGLRELARGLRAR
ncbi:putative peptidoglycan lipid II flippase [Motilibacter peucedani]|uniref:Putative peptidoglycan lipid II flippase n=1 Tax=Motilibacter peucedani TaxID=598650 RepID=A0A420XSK8_9ACTN|nr:lipid II flippase MurJ [Motilibacter peucedani]RKS77854.1 putative peptidoglycan lipid II flippase [Motilibacter peucedani]